MVIQEGWFPCALGLNFHGNGMLLSKSEYLKSDFEYQKKKEKWKVKKKLSEKCETEK